MAIDTMATPMTKFASWSEHLQHLEVLPQKIDYLGYVVSSTGVAMDPTKISSVFEWPINIDSSWGTCLWHLHYTNF
ncbi:hypothetical protein CR513_34137, partial [Mucuna pruriens]